MEGRLPDAADEDEDGGDDDDDALLRESARDFVGGDNACGGFLIGDTRPANEEVGNLLFIALLTFLSMTF